MLRARLITASIGLTSNNPRKGISPGDELDSLLIAMHGIAFESNTYR